MRKQLKEKTGSELPTAVIACVGGGSNAAGAFYHFLNELSVKLVAVEAAGCGINSGMSAATTQLVEPHSISAGLDYPGIGPLHAHLFTSGRGIFMSVTDEEALKAAFEVSRTE